MIEPRWEVKIGSRVMATDGEYGHLQQLLVDPHQERVVALLVRPHRLIPSPTVVVPEELIANASEQGVRLEISREQVNALPKYWSESGLLVEDQIYQADDELFAVRGKQGMDVGRAPSSRGPGMIEDHLTESKREHLGLRIYAGKQVFCQDGYAGRVSLILSDAKGGFKGFVLHVGHLPLVGSKRIVPAAWVQEVDRENVHLSVNKNDLKSLPVYCKDNAIEEKVDDALWSDVILRNTDYREIDATVQDGIVILRGHVISLMNERRVENAIHSVPGMLGVENELVVDQELVLAVAQALGKDELTRFERISVRAQKGIVTLDGLVDSAAIRDAAEGITASIPQVRGVINDLQAPDLVIDPEEQQVRQPPIGQEVSAADMLLGQVERVIIDPHHRRVTAFVVHGYFPDLGNIDDDRLPGEGLRKERSVLIPVEAVRYETGSSVVLMESGIETAEHPDFNPARFISPPANWQPPYPYRWEEVLFDHWPQALLSRGNGTGEIPLDVYEAGDHMMIKASLPGIQPEDLNVELGEHVLTISGEIRQNVEHVDKTPFLNGRAGDQFKRSVKLPCDFTVDEVEAGFEDGILSLTFYKKDSRLERAE